MCHEVMRENLSGKSIAGIGLSKCKGPEVRGCLRDSRDSLPAAEWAGWTDKK